MFLLSSRGVQGQIGFQSVFGYWDEIGTYLSFSVGAVFFCKFLNVSCDRFQPVGFLPKFDWEGKLGALEGDLESESVPTGYFYRNKIGKVSESESKWERINNDYKYFISERFYYFYFY